MEHGIAWRLEAEDDTLNKQGCKQINYEEHDYESVFSTNFPSQCVDGEVSASIKE